MTSLPEAKTAYDKSQRVIIGHLLNFPSSAPDVYAHLHKEQSEAFTLPILRHVFEAICSLYDRGAEIREMSVASELERTGKSTRNMASVLMDCVDAAPSVPGARPTLRIIA